MTNTNKFNKAIEALRYTTENYTIRQDVIFWAEDQAQDGNEADKLFNDLMQNGCQSGMVSELIYYNDTLKFFDNHRSEIEQIVYDNYGIEDLESTEGANWLADNFGLEDHDERVRDLFRETMELAEERVCIQYEGWEEMDEEEFQYLVDEENEHLLMYATPHELTTRDKNALAWMAFEYVASTVYDELVGMVEAE